MAKFLPPCLGPDCRGPAGGGSCWRERIPRSGDVEEPQQQHQQQKQPQQHPHPRATRPEREHPECWLPGRDHAPEALQQVLQKLVQQQAELVVGQANLMSLMERQHQEFCQSLQASRLAFPAFPAGLTEVANASSAHGRASTGTRDNEVSVEHAKWPSAKHVISRRSPPATTYMGEKRMQMATIVDHPYCDVLMGLIIILNLLTMIMQSHWKGLEVAHKLELRGSDAGWPQAENAFQVIECVFCSVYAAECLLRICLLGTSYVWNIWNAMDLGVVVASCIDSFLLTPMQLNSRGSGGLILGRLARVVRVFRFMKAVRFMKRFEELKVLILTLVSSIPSLLWSMVIVLLMIVSGAVLMMQLTVSFMEDNSESPELRLWVYHEFGTAGRAIFTMFEATFTAAWTLKARRFILEVNPVLSIFWVTYVVVVNFAVMRVIAALFLKQTLAVANLENQKKAMEMRRQKDAFATQVRKIFEKGDTSGDGQLSREEFEEMMEDKEVVDMFEKLELDSHEAHTLFELLSDDDGVVDYEEFLTGAMKMKNSAQVLDVVQVLHGQLIIHRSMEELTKKFKILLSALRPPWQDG